MDSYADEIVGAAESVIITPRLCKELVFALVFSVSVFHILTPDIRAAFFRSAQHVGNLPLTAPHVTLTHPSHFVEHPPQSAAGGVVKSVIIRGGGVRAPY